MTETTAPQNGTDLKRFHLDDADGYNTVGHVLPGSQTAIKKQNANDTEGEICMRGRNVCMGYLKNPEACSKTFDNEGFLHSGDLGRIN